MRHLLPLALLTACAFAAPPEPKFHAVTIDPGIQIGYGVAVADVDGDGQPDILLADKKQFVWYRNPGTDKAADPSAWSKFLIAENLTEHDNVCLAAQDLDGDGKCELAVGAEWNPSDTVNSGAVFYLIPPADRTQRWEPVKFPNVEPTTHRMKWVRLQMETWGLVVVPLHGRANKNGEGAPAKVLCYHKPADIHREWKAEVVDESMHMTHNFHPTSWSCSFPPHELMLAGKEGVKLAVTDPVKIGSAWGGERFAYQDSENPNFIGAGEVRDGALPYRSETDFRHYFAAVEPMHGNRLVAYTLPPRGTGRSSWTPHVLTDQLTEGHALACGDLLGTGSDQIVVGWRGNPQKPKAIGIKLFTPLEANGEQWRDTFIDDTDMACEDLVLADLNGDHKLDIVASGRSTHNLKIYLNETAR